MMITACMNPRRCPQLLKLSTESEKQQSLLKNRRIVKTGIVFMARIKQIMICPNQLPKHARANIVYGFTFSCFKTLSLVGASFYISWALFSTQFLMIASQFLILYSAKFKNYKTLSTYFWTVLNQISESKQGVFLGFSVRNIPAGLTKNCKRLFHCE